MLQCIVTYCDVLYILILIYHHYYSTTTTTGGRPSPDMFNHINIDAYGNKTPLHEVGQVCVCVCECVCMCVV